jgi:hypothetical protein
MGIVMVAIMGAAPMAKLVVAVVMRVIVRVRVRLRMPVSMPVPMPVIMAMVAVGADAADVKVVADLRRALVNLVAQHLLAVLA